MGKDAHEELNLIRLEPNYRRVFGAGGSLDATTDLQSMTEQIGALCGAKDAKGFEKYVLDNRKKLNFSNLGILRPSFLMGKRKESRVAEKIGILTFNALAPLLLGPFQKMRPISSEIVAKAMIKIAKENLQKITFESDEILKL